MNRNKNIIRGYLVIGDVDIPAIVEGDFEGFRWGVGYLFLGGELDIENFHVALVDLLCLLGLLEELGGGSGVEAGGEDFFGGGRGAGLIVLSCHGLIVFLKYRMMS